MKHIKTPISLLVEPACCVLFDADKNYVGSIPINTQAAGQEIVHAINQYDDLIAVANDLYDTVQALRHVINGALMGKRAEIPEDVRTRCQERIQRYKAVVAPAKEDRCTGS